MKKNILVLSFVFLLTGISYAINARLPFNGESWNNLQALTPPEEKIAKTMLIRGCYEGAFATKPDKALKLYSTDRNLEDLVEYVNRFYDNPKNSKIPVGVALRVISMRLKGVPEKDINNYLEHLRTFIDSLFEETQGG